MNVSPFPKGESMKLTDAQRQEFLGIVSRGNKAEAEAWLKGVEAAEPQAKTAPTKWQADLLAKTQKK